MKPFRESLPNRYCRLFAPSILPRNGDRCCDHLTALGRAMIDDGSRVSDSRPEILVDCGYTYFGQFVAHDLTKDPNTLEEAWRKEPGDLENLRTPRLDLDSLYGNGPIDAPELYENDGVRLRIGLIQSANHHFDISTGLRGERVMSDDRNAENLIVRQMTAVFARLHNLAVEHFEGKIKNSNLLFDRARQQTRWQFQWLVCHDYLPTLLNLDVYNRAFTNTSPTMQWKRFSIPIEFSAAAMRFGHAMVRENYKFAFGNDMMLRNAFGRTGDLGALGDEQLLNWGFFFQGAGDGGAVTTRPIDTRLSNPLHSLPDDLIGVPEMVCPHARFAKYPSELAVRTLLRGAGLRLASGQTVAARLGHRVLTRRQLRRNADDEKIEQGEILAEAGLLQETPLWYYILKESELFENGNRLGPTGSFIVAETIHAALRSDPNSILNQHHRSEIPPIWDLPDERARIYNLSELFRIVPSIQAARTGSE